MNYYEHHIRDYDAATAHLSWDQDMAYSRLLRWYYRKEKPLPGDVAEVCRQIRATTKPQRAAVESVLREFFELREDGWHQDVCDEAIGKFKSREPERAAMQQNEMTRLTRHRTERAALFGEINKAGFHLPYNAPISEVRALVDRIRSTPETPATLPATGTETPATDLQRLPSPQSPVPIHQTPDTSTPEYMHSGSDAREGSLPKRTVGNGRPGQQTAAEYGDAQLMDAFAAIRSAYPPRSGTDHNWLMAEHHWRIRITEHTPEFLLAAVERYRAYVDGGGVSSSAHVLGADKFFSDTGRKAWSQPWNLPKAATAPVRRMRTAHEIAEALDPENTALSAP